MLTRWTARWVHSGRWLLLAMLALLHLALLLGLESQWTRPILLAHLGLFLVWQPLWRRETRLGWAQSAFIISISLAALIWLDWWLLAFWVSGLFALVGGRVFTAYSLRQRAFYLLLMAYLLAVLLLLIVPHLFALPELRDVTAALMWVALPLLLLLMAVLPLQHAPTDDVQTVDFIYVLLLFALLTLLVLGALAFVQLAQLTYLDALLRTLLALGGALGILGLLWSPRLGYGGLQAAFSRQLLSIGTPLEEWLKRIARSAQDEPDAAAFLHKAVAHLAALPWVAGLTWLAEAGHGTLGEASPNRVELIEGDLQLILFTRNTLSPTLLLHLRLLVQVLGHFYQAKRHEQQLRDIARQQAIFETGARLTHDLKNMLQSLFALTSIAQHDPARAQPVLKAQLPALAQRIETLLAKLKVPQQMAETTPQPLAQWWQALQQRHQHRDLDWQADELPDTPIPAALFDCVADNLIENACNKRQREPGLGITVRLDIEPLAFSVTDSGSPVPPQVAQQLLRTILGSEDGLGIGLYQAAQLAERNGYRLRLEQSRAGCVRFALRQA